MSFLEEMQTVIRNRENLIEGANKCFEKYCTGTGHPEYYHQLTAEGDAELVAQNYAGFQAVISGLGLVARMRGLDVEDCGYDILADIATGTINETEQEVLLRFANACWGACQPFRTDKGPLGRADRVNVFDLLIRDPEQRGEVAKDLYQITAAATCFLNWLENV